MLQSLVDRQSVADDATDELAASGDKSLSFIWICTEASAEAGNTLACYLDHAASLPGAFEFVVVNNGADPSAVRRLVDEQRWRPLAIKLVQLYRRCPESAALAAGIRQSQAARLALVPSYLQCDPRGLTGMLQAMDAGLDYVAAVRAPRVDGRWGQWRSRWFNTLVRLISGVQLTDINAGLKLLRREVVECVPVYGELHIYLPILAAQQGFRVGEIPVRHLTERHGAGRSLGMYLRRLLDLLTMFFLSRFTQKPFRFFGGIGSGLVLAGGGINLVLAVQRLTHQTSLVDRPLLVLGSLLLVLGIQTFSLGLIGELIIFTTAGGLTDFRIEQVLDRAGSSQDDNVEAP